MPMRRFCTLLLIAALGAAAPSVRAIDAARSSARFSVSHIWVEHVSGSVPVAEGSVTLAGDSPIPTDVSAVLDATRVATGEPDRDRQLQSPDFFDVKRFPRWSFTSTAVIPKGPASFEMDGNLTIHGVTQPERLNVTVSGAPDAPHYHAAGEIDRHAFGMSVTRLDPTIGGTVAVTLEIALR
ncbi:MAG TPA: YceI family protein [Candidatus Nitrosotalea sp.]|nr:YceI family protein [Candidatus Nitrosotalea sp.]